MLRELNTQEMEAISGGNNGNVPTGGIELHDLHSNPALLADQTQQAQEANPHLGQIMNINGLETMIFNSAPVTQTTCGSIHTAGSGTEGCPGSPSMLPAVPIPNESDDTEDTSVDMPNFYDDNGGQ